MITKEQALQIATESETFREILVDRFFFSDARTRVVEMVKLSKNKIATIKALREEFTEAQIEEAFPDYHFSPQNPVGKMGLKVAKELFEFVENNP